MEIILGILSKVGINEGNYTYESGQAGLHRWTAPWTYRTEAPGK